MVQQVGVTMVPFLQFFHHLKNLDNDDDDDYNGDDDDDEGGLQTCYPVTAFSFKDDDD